MSLDIEMVRDGKRWNFAKQEITLGRDATSDIRLTADEFLMVSRRHAIVRVMPNGELWLEDQNSFNGTLLNGRRVSTERLRFGDVIRLGEDGPEFRVISSRTSDPGLRPGSDPGLRTSATGSTNTPPLGSYSPPTVFSGEGGSKAPAPTQYSAPKLPKESQPTNYSAVPKAAATTGTGARPATGGFATTSHTPAPDVSTQMPGTSGGLQAPSLSASQMNAAPSSYDEVSPGEEAMLENKIAVTRNLLIFVILLCIVLGGVIVYQGQEIRKTRETLNSMQRDAQNAVGQFMPQLNNRLNRFDSRLDEFQTKMDQMDSNMKRAEDRFVVRMDSEMPKIMDRYLQMKANELQRSGKAQVQVR